MAIIPVTPVDKEKLVATDTTIILDMSLTPAQVDVNGLTIFNGSAFQASWTGSLVNLLGGGKRFSASPPSAFTLGSVVQVYVRDSAGDAISYKFQVGTEKFTTTDDTASPTTAIAGGLTYMGYVRDPGVMHVRITNPVSAEIPLIAASVVDMGYDPQLNKLVVFFVSNGKVYVTTADPGNAGNSILPPGEASTPTKVVGFPFTDVKPSTVGSGGIRNSITKADFPPIKQAPSPEAVAASTFGSGGIRGIEYGFPRSVTPEITSLDPVRLRIPRPIDTPEASLIVGFFPFKGSNNYTGGTFLPFVELPAGAQYVEVVDPVFTPEAIYSAVCVYKQGQTSATLKTGLSAAAISRPLGADLLIPTTCGGGGIKNSFTSTTFPPLKQAPPIDSVTPSVTGGGGIRMYFGR